MLREVPTSVWLLTLETGAHGTTRVKRENDVVSGLWKVITAVGFCMRIAETEGIFFKSVNSSRYGLLLAYLGERVHIEGR